MSTRPLRALAELTVHELEDGRLYITARDGSGGPLGARTLTRREVLEDEVLGELIKSELRDG